MKDEEFANTKTALIEDHQASLEHFTIMIDRERQEINSKHATEIDSYKANVAKVTADLADQIALAEKNLQELTATHNSNMETLTTDKNALIAAAEASKVELETELQQQIATLTEVLGNTQSKFEVSLHLALDNDRNCKRMRRILLRLIRMSWWCVPPGDICLRKV
jgi:hypothetical protein